MSHMAHITEELLTLKQKEHESKMEEELEISEEEDIEYDNGGPDMFDDDEEEELFCDYHDVNSFDDNELFQNGLLISKEFEDIKTSVNIDEEIYESCKFSLKVFCRFLLILKSNHNMGDVAFASVVGSIISFMPTRNKLALYVGENPSVYILLNAIDKLSNLKNCCRVMKFKSCDMGKCVLSKKNNEDKCYHPKIKQNFFYYLPIRMY